MATKKRVAGLVSQYFAGSHADVIVGKVLEGYRHDGGKGPDLELAGLYVDQFPANDLSRDLSRKHGFPIFATIEEAVTLGRRAVAVDGVLLICEHGDYPTNARGQKLYRRRQWFEQVTQVFAKHDKVAPVFNDKHLGVTWQDATWMVDKARAMGIPLLAGSSLPLSYRTPEFDPPPGTAFDAALGIGYSGLDIYGIHALEVYQAIVERRRGAEAGVEWAQCLQGKAMWDALDRGDWSRELLEAGLAAVPHAGAAGGDFRGRPELQHDEAALFRFRYRDGFHGAVAMLQGVARANGFAARLRGSARPVATHVEERPRPYPHFIYLVKAIEALMHTWHAPYPAERTLLTTGLHDALLSSRAQGQARLATPYLAVRYQPRAYPHAPKPDL
jgi:hypothetical protein